jgi:translation initiation factor 5B
VKAALGVKISAPDLEKAIAGSRLLVCGPDDDEDDLKDEVMSDLTSLLSSIDKSGKGVCVQASTLGSLEALLDFLKVSKIPVSGINIGPVHKKDVMRSATMLERARELAVILCFDVPVDKDAERMAEELGIRIFKGMSRAAVGELPLNLFVCVQRTSSTTCSTRSPRTTPRSWRPSVVTPPRKLSGRAG